MEYIADLQKTKGLAQSLAKNAKLGDVFCLIGDLGAGKTEFARSFIGALVNDAKVTSPTYNIVQVYEHRALNTEKMTMLRDPCSIHHFDLYRIKTADELEEIGFSELLENGISLIEWPQIAADYYLPTRSILNLQLSMKILGRLPLHFSIS